VDGWTDRQIDGKGVDMTTDELNEQIKQIKGHMPGVHKAIKDKADTIGNEAYRMVRQGILGQPCRFYAFERGRVVGTPFTGHQIEADVALSMVQFGVGFCVIWAETPKG
jgi:putative methionine-R-sulfoxide reductase with GAF domain